MTNKDHEYFRSRPLLRFLALGAIALLMVIIGFASVPLMRFVSQPEQFRLWIDQRGIWGVLGYMATVIIQVVVAILPGEPFEIAAGYAFGAWEGTLIYLAAATLGSILVFALVRRFGRRLVVDLFSEKKVDLLRFLKSNKRRELLFALIFTLPGTPKDLMCYAAGLTDIPWPVWLIICSLGRIPAAITSTLGGNALGTGNYVFAIAVFVLSLAVSGGGLLLFYRICDRENKVKKPLIALPDTGSGLFHKYMFRKYVTCLRRSGARVKVFPPKCWEEAMDCQGLLLPGGDDVDPARYGREKSPKCGKTDPQRDEAETLLMEKFLATGRPFWGICRGEQMMNVFFGGTLHQDIKELQKDSHNSLPQRGKGSHWVTIEEESLLHKIVGTDRLFVNSLHHQAAEEIPESLHVTARSDDGFVEALEHREYPFCLGVQWHPEHMPQKEQKALFQAFVDEAKKFL